MRRRRRATSDVSLFAFQDVMASVIGVIFFIVLLVALNIVEEPVQASGPEAPNVEELRGRARELEAESARLRSQLAELERASSRVASPERAAAEVRSLHRTLTALHEAIRGAQASRVADEQRVADAEAATAAALERGLELEAELRDVEERTRAGPRVSYIIDSGPGTPEPWLVELSSDAIRAASADGAAAVLAFGGAGTQARREQFLSWVGSLERGSSYFVLLIKPSAVGWAYELAAELHEAGFRFGTDLLPESWQAFE